MQVSQEDLREIDTLIAALSKIRFDVSGIECMRLASTLSWLGQHRSAIARDVEAASTAEQTRIAAGLALLGKPPPPPAEAFKRSGGRR